MSETNSRDMSQEEVKHRFVDLPSDQFPLRILMFSPGGELVFDEEVTGPGALPVPGKGPGSVRYSLFLYGNGKVSFQDDPTCSGTVDTSIRPEELHAKMAHLIEMCRFTGRHFLEKSSEILTSIDFHEEETGNRRLFKEFFEMQARIGEQMIEAARVTEEWLSHEAEQTKKEE